MNKPISTKTYFITWFFTVVIFLFSPIYLIFLSNFFNHLFL